MKILHVASEVAPVAQSGGLADVLAGLPAAQAEEPDVEVAVLIPLYRGVAERLAAANIALTMAAPQTIVVGAHAFHAAIHIALVGRVRYGFVDIPSLFDRAGTLYGPGGAGEWGDNHVRFAALGVAAQLAGPALFGSAPDVLHVHDWQGGPAAIYASRSEAPPTIVATVHNLAYRGIFPKAAMTELGLPWELWTPHHLEFWDQVSFLKGALAVADVATTVSPTYATEILTPALGEGLDGFLTNDVERVVGIVNGIDAHAWDPATDPALAAPFTSRSLANKLVCKRALAAELDLPISDDDIVIGVIARMTGQKGLDLVAEIVPELHRLGAKLVVLGAGEDVLEDRFRYLETAFSATVRTRIGFDSGLARRIYAGSDLFVMPSRFEPCGLGQLYAMRYGSIPVVHAVGGLKDTVTDPGDDALSRGAGTGFAFVQPNPTALLMALERAAALFRKRDAFATLVTAAMQRDSSWSSSARAYLSLYRSLR